MAAIFTFTLLSVDAGGEQRLDRKVEMIRHRGPGSAGITLRNRARDRAVAGDARHSLGVIGAARPTDAPSLARDDVERTDDERKQWIARSARDRLMEGDVVLHDARRDREIPGHRLGEREDRGGLVVAATQRGKRDGAHLDGAAHVVDLLDRDLIGMDSVIEHEAQNGGIDRRNARSAPVADVDELQRGERAKRLSDHGARDPKFEGKRVFARKRIALAQTLRADALFDGRHDLLDQAAWLAEGIVREGARSRNHRPIRQDCSKLYEVIEKPACQVWVLLFSISREAFGGADGCMLSGSSRYRRGKHRLGRSPQRPLVGRYRRASHPSLCPGGSPSRRLADAGLSNLDWFARRRGVHRRPDARGLPMDAGRRVRTLGDARARLAR